MLPNSLPTPPARRAADRVHPAGPLTHRDLLQMLPMLDETVVIQVNGAQLAAALENGVAEWPKHEGRFPQARAACLPLCCAVP